MLSLPEFSMGSLGSVSNIYTNNSLYTFSEVCTDLLSSARLTGGVSNATTPQYTVSCYLSDITKTLLTLAKGFLDWPVMFLD